MAVSRSPGLEKQVLAGILLAIHATLLLVSSRLQFPTRNEVGHVPAGLACWETGNYRLYCVNPPLAKMVATLPTLLFRPDTSGINYFEAPGQRLEWLAARTFASDNASNYFTLIWSARLAEVAWSLLAAWILYRWANRLYGGRAGLVALTVWCFGPNVLAHGALATADIPAAAAAVAATYVYRGYLREGTWGLAIAAGGALGVAQLMKFTLLILYGVWPVLWLLHSADLSNDRFRKVALGKRALQGAAILVVSLVTINLGYELDRSMKRLGDYDFVSRMFAGEPADRAAGGAPHLGNRFRGTWLGALAVPLPEHYLVGIDLQRRDFEGQFRSYMAGEWRDRGWWYYYVYGLAVKVPVSTWCLVLWAISLTILRHQSSAPVVEELTLWVPPVCILLLVSSQTGFTQHLRYVLPITPFVAAATGKLGYFLQPGRLRSGGIVLTLLAASAVSSLSVYPHSLSYFNELAGGPENGHRHLVDSNIDWGQDLFFFKQWVDRNLHARPIGLAYFNYIDYRIVGAEYGEVSPDPPEFALEMKDAARFGPHPGWFGVDIYSIKSGQHKYFERFSPIAKAGYSIFIYFISPEAANRAREQMGLPVLPSTNQAQLDHIENVGRLARPGTGGRGRPGG